MLHIEAETLGWGEEVSDHKLIYHNGELVTDGGWFGLDNGLLE